MPKRDEGPLAERATYRAFHMVSTRWADNDQYGHINNAKFYEFVDSAVNAHLLIADALGESIGLVVDSGTPRAASATKKPSETLSMSPIEAAEMSVASSSSRTRRRSSRASRRPASMSALSVRCQRRRSHISPVRCACRPGS